MSEKQFVTAPVKEIDKIEWARLTERTNTLNFTAGGTQRIDFRDTNPTLFKIYNFTAGRAFAGFTDIVNEQNNRAVIAHGNMATISDISGHNFLVITTLNAGRIVIISSELKDIIPEVRNTVEVIAVDAPILPKQIMTVVNHLVVTANSEQSFLFPNNTKKFMIHPDLNDPSPPIMRIAHEAGRVATPTRPFLHLPSGSIYTEENLNLQNFTLWFTVDRANYHVIITHWR